MRVSLSSALGAMASFLFIAGCGVEPERRPVDQSVGDGSGDDSSIDDVAARYSVTALVTDKSDPDLVNPWGIAAGEGVFWIADEDTGKVSVYDGNGKTSEEYPTGHFELGEGITGVAALEADEEEDDNSDEGEFLIANSPTCSKRTAAEFVFANLGGVLIAFNDESPVNGVTVVDRSADGAVYIGVAKIDMPAGPRLLAADFANARIDIFDTEFRLVNAPDAFVDPEVPEGFAPFNVMTFDDQVYVAYAKQGDDGEEEPGPGLGMVSIFSASGVFERRLHSELLNAPWGLAIASSESKVCDDTAAATLFVGNFGDGHITAVDLETLEPLGQLNDDTGKPIEIEGLWGLITGSDEAGDEDALYFAAGPDDEQGGVFGRIDRIAD